MTTETQAKTFARKLASACHPDKHGDDGLLDAATAVMKRLNSAMAKQKWGDVEALYHEVKAAGVFKVNGVTDDDSAKADESANKAREKAEQAAREEARAQAERNERERKAREEAANKAQQGLIVALRDLQAQGKTKAQARAWLEFMHNIKGSIATDLLDSVYGAQREGATSKADVVAFIIACEKQGMKNAQIIEQLCVRFNWSVSTGRTVIAHLEYMREYARQTSNR